MQVGLNTVVSFHYTLRNSAGEQVETSRDGEPTLYLHGHNNVMPALEKQLEGRKVGDTFTATLTAAEAFGEKRSDSVQRVAAKYFKHAGKLTPGQAVRVNTDNGPMTVTVVKVGKFSVDVDTNHPLAGQDVSFDVEVMDIREASPEEIEHGHAHGAGGHHH
jgi:FKBP-type peptidyl-prolyl cis-trans isomerase SlyD